MNKLAMNNDQEDKKIISFTINKEIKLKLLETLTKSHKYNLKKKSDWSNEAIEMLIQNPYYKEMVVSNAEGNNEKFVFDKIHMTFKQRCLFAEIRNEVVKAYPDIKGPQTSIIRAAILSRLTRKT
jgi:hypothetical protein